jgi:hypothetical protein
MYSKTLVAAVLGMAMSMPAFAHGHESGNKELGHVKEMSQGNQGVDHSPVIPFQSPFGESRNQDAEIASAQNNTLSAANSNAQGYVKAKASRDAQTFSTQKLKANTAKVNTEVVGRAVVGQQVVGQQMVGQQNVGQQVVGQQVVGQQNVGQQSVGSMNAGNITAQSGNIGGVEISGRQITHLAPGTSGTDAANVNQVTSMGRATLTSANSTSVAGDKATLTSANSTAAAGDSTTLNKANADSQVMANVAQSNAYSYTNTQTAVTLNQADNNAQGYANQAQSNAENFAQNAANTAQGNAQQYAAAGIAAALAMAPSPMLRAGHAYIGVQGAEYDGAGAMGARVTYQISRNWNANLGYSEGFGMYAHAAVTAGVGYQFLR